MKNTTRTHIAWVDLLRIFACFFVIVSHSCDFFTGQLGTNHSAFLSASAWGSLARPCVPLFIMISGVLLLPVKLDMRTFYARRMKRILLPLLFWSLVMPILFYLYLSNVATTTLNIDMADHTLTATLKKMYTFVFNFNYDTIPFWYLYMLLGLYLFIPIIGAWLKEAGEKDIRLFLAFWLISLLLPYIQLLAPLLGYTGNYGDMGLLGVCTWNVYGTFYYFSGFLGYIVLAHYLVRFPLQWTMRKTCAIAGLLFALGYGFTLFTFIHATNYFPEDPNILEVFWNFNSINVAMMTFAVFILIQKMRVRPSARLNKVAALTFGVYLCHFVVVQSGYDLVSSFLPLPAYLQIPLIAVYSFLVSLAIIWAMSKVKALKTVAGV